MCDRCEELEAEIADLRKLNGFVLEDERHQRLRKAFGLTPIENWLLNLLYERGDRGITKEHAITHMPSRGDPLDRDLTQVAVQVSKIRRKLGFNAIESIWSVGYRITPEGRRVVAEALA